MYSSNMYEESKEHNPDSISHPMEELTSWRGHMGGWGVHSNESRLG